jgi:hypothetical protein
VVGRHGRDIADWRGGKGQGWRKGRRALETYMHRYNSTISLGRWSIVVDLRNVSVRLDVLDVALIGRLNLRDVSASSRG